MHDTIHLVAEVARGYVGFRGVSMNITIHGVGYVGLVTGACLAEAGNHVLCFDINAARIGELQKGRSPIYEPGLEDMLLKNVAAGRLMFTNSVEEAVAHATIQFIAVATPAQENGEADLGYVLSVARNIATHMQAYKLIVNKSTVPVNAAEMVRSIVSSTLAERVSAEMLAEPLAFDVASNPEFLKEGMAIEDFMRPSRVVIGVDSQRACQYLKELYAPFVSRPEQLLWMGVRSAELAKYASNAMLATRISFMNTMALLAEAFGADIEDIRTVMGMDPRIGALYLHPGPGYGGSCFPKDMKALIHMAKVIGIETPLLTAVEEVNHTQKARMFEKISAYFHGNLKGRTIAVWGLAFKAGTDDIRDSASTVLIRALLDAGAHVMAYDALAAGNFIGAFGPAPGLSIVLDAHTALIGAEALVIMTDTEAFKTMDYGVLKASLRSPVIFDARNMFDPVLMESLGFTYQSIGRNSAMCQNKEAALDAVAM